MNKTEQSVYLMPEIEVYEVNVEQGFTGSNMESIGEEKPPVGWE